MTLKRALMVLLLATLAALAGCGDQSGRDPEANVDPGLGPITYVVTGITTAGKQHLLVPDTEIRIRFADGKVTLTAGCNTMSGDYTLEESRLTVHDLATTDMGCDQTRMDQDTWLAGLFDKAVQFMPGADASIVSGSTVLTMSDRENVSPDKPLVGTEWVLDSIGTGATGPDGAVSSVPETANATLKVKADGTFVAQWGCPSSIGGRADVDGGAITWTVAKTVLARCGGFEGATRAGNAFHDVLAGRTTYTIEENRLTISRGDRSLGFAAAG